MSRRGRALFVTGTDTGVGKTWVTASLARALRAAGRSVGVVKPVETGWPDASSPPSDVHPDGLFLSQAAHDRDPLDEIVPFRLAAPLAPLIAAERAGVAIDLERIVEVIESKRRRNDVVLIEGAGGLLVPITAEASTLDLMVRVKVPVLVVAANRLGVINHALLTLASLDAGGVQIAGLVLNDISPDADLAQQSNAGYLRRVLGARFLGEFPYARDAGALDAAAELLASSLALLS